MIYLILITAAAVAVTLQADPPVTADGVQVTLKWVTAPTNSDCEASGAWSGTRPPTGVEAQPLTGTATSRTYSLTCKLRVVEIQWDPPTTNTDGSPLTNLAGFKAYRRIDSGPEVLIADIPNKTARSFLDTDTVRPGVYTYTMTAYNTEGGESSHSNPASKTVGVKP